MATIRKRGKKWQAQVRRKGRQLQSKSFPLKSEAEAWARRIEAELDRENGPIETFDLRAITLRDMLQRYRTEVTPTKRAPRQENAIIDQLLREDIAELAIPDVGSAELSAFRDKRLQYQKPATVTRHLAVLQHAYNVARQDWGWPIDRNPV
ncbi:MAG: hypothetical protein OXR84_01455, partial [Magnetovibrio sp.]|nr:hypothetical protein [Magnetovibrio sp.]